VFGSNLLFTQDAGYFDSAEGMLPLLHTWTLGVAGTRTSSCMALWPWQHPDHSTTLP